MKNYQFKENVVRDIFDNLKGCFKKQICDSIVINNSCYYIVSRCYTKYKDTVMVEKVKDFCTLKKDESCNERFSINILERHVLENINNLKSIQEYNKYCNISNSYDKIVKFTIL